MLVTLAKRSASFSQVRAFSSEISIRRVAVTGATGMLGKQLVKSLKNKNIDVIQLTTRRDKTDGSMYWSPLTGLVAEPQRLNGIDAVINLTGENVGSGEGAFAFIGRWSDAKKARILESRVSANQLLLKTIEGLEQKPKIYLAASAIGYYGYKDSNTLFDEQAKKGEGFLANVCESIEKEVEKFDELNIRACSMRFGAILSTEGGVLGKLILPFSLGGGGIIGNGKQGFSWVTVDDAVRAIEFMLTHAEAKGPINVVSPNPTTNHDFTKALGRALNRPTVVPMPTIIAKTVFGEMGEELLLGGQKVVPRKLQAMGFEFNDKNIHEAVARIIQQRASS